MNLEMKVAINKESASRMKKKVELRKGDKKQQNSVLLKET